MPVKLSTKSKNILMKIIWKERLVIILYIMRQYNIILSAKCIFVRYLAAHQKLFNMYISCHDKTVCHLLATLRHNNELFS